MGNLFGTDGIRGPVGVSPFTIEDTARLGMVIGEWAIATYGVDAQLLIAHDTRESSDWVTSALCTGLLLSPLTVHLAGVLPTPAISHTLKQEIGFHCGIILSASHNLFTDNGIKIVDSALGKIEPQDEAIISAAYYQKKSPSYTTFGTVASYENAAAQYIAGITTFFSQCSLTGLTVVLDCANGATFTVAPAIFSALGAEVITLHAKPNGKNINAQCGALAPHSLQKAVIAHEADFGCAFDGDGDRVIMVNRSGQIKNGDDMLALLSNHPQYAKQQTVVGTVMSNQGLEQYLTDRDKQLQRTAVGDRWVAAQLSEQNLLLGGEQSGHIILHDYLPTGDGIATALRVIESVIHANNLTMTTFDTYPQKLINVPVVHKKDLKEPTIAAILANYRKQLDSGRLFVRYSGTENLLRVMVEDRENDAVDRICSRLAQALEKELQ